jgi:mRNA degradation ribonuclease J1/J2
LALIDQTNSTKHYQWFFVTNELFIDRDSLSDDGSIVVERLYDNKESVVRYEHVLSGQKSTSCGVYYRQESAVYVSTERVV